MGTSDLTKFPAGSQDKGLNNFEPAVSADVTWSQDTVNVGGGVRRGVGVRYGVAPLAGHSNTETPAGNATNGIQRSETTSGTAGLTFRELIFGVVPITIAPYDGAYPKANRQYYVYLVGLDDSTNVTLDACLGSTLVSSVNKQESTLVAGLAQSSYRQESPLVRLHKTEMLNLPTLTTPTAADMQTALREIAARYWMPYAHISVSGKRVPYQWMLGNATSTPAITTAASVNIWTATVSVGTSQVILCGEPSEIETREYIDEETRFFHEYLLTNTGRKLDLSYTKTITGAFTAAQPAYGTGSNYLGLGGAKKGGGTAYSSTSCALINDPGSFTNTRHDAILCAGERPIAIVYQDWLKATKGMMPRWVDLSQPGCTPRLLGNSLNNGQPSMSPNAVIGLAGENTGILRLGLTYDFGASLYYKHLDYETNVTYITSVENTTGDVPAGADFTAITFDDTGTTGNIWENLQTEALYGMPWEFTNFTAPATGADGREVEVGRGFHINDFEYRVYFRASGTNEWLPGGAVDAAKYWFFWDWDNDIPRFCTGPTAQLPGGQPNGFVDYSPLPKQRYICTTVFQQRAFWWSEKSMHFSYVNNIYAYPTRNIVTCPTGKWRGGIVHSQKDLSQQLSRLVVFGDQTYSCRFTGETTLQSVRISSETVGQFAIDGSDFRMEYLCDSTAFSYRAACVAEGVLYWWGPQGVYRDDGMTPSAKISTIPLEPNIWDYVDMARDTEVHSIYNKRTKEVLWFYPPKVADATYPTHGLAYSTETGKFYPFKMRCQVDSSQNIKIENDDTPDDVDGERILLHCRETTAATVQRTFYFDDIVEAGEQGPARELTVLTVATPTAGTRRLTLATGSIGITAGGIAVNDLICIQNAKGYAPSLTLADDMIAKITAINNASNYIDILLPDGAAFDAAASLTGQTAFPVYQKHPTTAGLHGITYLMQTNYWLPDGVSSSWYWLYLYFMFRYSGIPTPTDPFTGRPSGEQILLTYQSLVCEAAISDTLSLVNNSAGQCQIHHPMRNVGRAASGQALKYALSGIHIGNPWTLEYLEAHCRPEAGFTLKEFEG